MMKKTIGIFLLCFYTCTIYAQPEIIVGKPYDVIDARGKYYFCQGSEILAIKLKSNSLTLQKFNSENLSIQKIRMYDDFEKGFVIEKITQVKDKHHVFYSAWNGDEEQLFVREVNFKQGEFYGRASKILSVNHKLAAGADDKFSFYFSSDSSMILVQYRFKPDVKRNAKSFDIIGMCVVDGEMKRQWNKEVTMPYTEKKMNNLDYNVDSKGSVYIVTRVFDDNTTKLKDKDGDPNYTIEILKISASTQTLTTYPVSIPDKFIRTLWIYENPKGYMLCAGFYNVGEDNGNVDGVLLFKFSYEGKIYDQVSYEIPIEILNQYVSDRAKRKNEKKDDKDKAEFAALRLREVINYQDGSLLLVGEQSYVRTHTSYSTTPNGASRTTTYHTYHYDDLLVTKINANGNLVWMKKLPKRQSGGAGLGGMSYYHMSTSQDHYFLFLDNVKNKDLEIDKYPEVHVDGRGGFLTAYKINNESGKVSKNYVLNTRDVKGMDVFQFKPSRIVTTGIGEFVFEAYKKKKEDVLVKVRL
jgi:hypothetical protein